MLLRRRCCCPRSATRQSVGAELSVRTVDCSVRIQKVKFGFPAMSLTDVRQVAFAIVKHDCAERFPLLTIDNQLPASRVYRLKCILNASVHSYGTQLSTGFTVVKQGETYGPDN